MAVKSETSEEIPVTMVPTTVPPPPPFITFPTGMLNDAYKANNNLLRVILLRMPREIQLSIFEHPVLTTADRVCLALTCKTFTRAISSNPKLLALPEKLKHGEEAGVRECFLENEPLEDDATEGEIDHWVAHRKKLDHEHRNRVDEAEITFLFNRLGEGWNLSPTRFCHSCHKFVSIELSYWDERDVFFTYRSNSNLAKAWRRGHCQCGGYIEYGEDARNYVNEWIKPGSNKTKCLRKDRDE
ncbi:hypothetical protein PMZ80_001331 [Knufia obscura]|uniref:F-box domain-containing protein n=1 Tax=Knufia obscura TaxID=1635080 RepID=A0ABR0S4B2_9EURO|nr:hypothetical protein PMZ80_001331 [Knufia obscura]